MRAQMQAMKPPVESGVTTTGVTVYHGTRTEPGIGTQFGGLHVGTRQAALDRLENTPSERIGGRPGGEKVYKYHLKLQSPLGTEAEPLTETQLWHIINDREALREAQSQHDGVIYRNDAEDPGSLAYLVWDRQALQARGVEPVSEPSSKMPPPPPKPPMSLRR